MAYEFAALNGSGNVSEYTRVPRVMRDSDGLYVDVEATIYDHRNFDDDKERTVLLHIVRYLGKRSGAKKQVAVRQLPISEIRDLTGMHHDTVIAKLDALAARQIITFRIEPQGKKNIYIVGLNLPLSDWKVKQLHLGKRDAA